MVAVAVVVAVLVLPEIQQVLMVVLVLAGVLTSMQILLPAMQTHA